LIISAGTHHGSSLSLLSNWPHSLLSTPSGTDRLLSLVYYLSTLLAPQFSRLALLLTVKLPTPVPLVALTPASTALTVASNRLRRLAAKVSDVRMFMRLFGLVEIYQWGARTLRDPPKDPVIRSLVLGQIAANVGYQILENLAYLNMHSLLSFSKRTEGRMWLWSTRCWAAHIVLEFLKLERTRSLQAEKSRGVRGLVITGEEERKAQESWNKAWICNATTAPLSVCLALAVPERSVVLTGVDVDPLELGGGSARRYCGRSIRVHWCRDLAP